MKQYRKYLVASALTVAMEVTACSGGGGGRGGGDQVSSVPAPPPLPPPGPCVPTKWDYC